MRTPNFDASRLLQAARNRVAAIDTDAIKRTIRDALASAGIDTRSGPMKGVTDTIDQALASAGMGHGAVAGSAQPAPGPVIDIVARELHDTETDADTAPPRPATAEPGPDVARPGEFVARSFTNRAGTRGYKLYVPTGYGDAPMPLVVMLHGCTQSPDDFAAGTRMNRLADEHGFLVVYPAQAPNANGSKCWNWFKPGDQARDMGEPSILAGIAGEVAGAYRVDRRRVFVAGLSAGASMAVILGETYPEVFAGVGAHSGLPYAAAHDMPSAFAAMRGAAMAGPNAAQAAHAVPTIVFHGDRDATVDVRNGAAIVERAVALAAGGAQPVAPAVQQGSAAGRNYHRTLHADAAGRPVVEDWLLHGAGHAWSGGSAAGSYTDATGPDASAEMVRFFLALGPAATA